jgi:hypothetical protein
MSEEQNNNEPQNPAFLQGAVRCSFTQGDKVKIETEDFGTIYGEFHRYGASRYGAIVFINGVMRFVDEQSLNYA